MPPKPPPTTDRPPRPGVPLPASKEALEYFRFRELETGFDYRDVRQEQHALAFTVAKAMEMDLLKAIRAEVDRALAEGRTLRQFQDDLTPILRQRGWWGKKEMKDPKTGRMVPVQLGSPRRLRTIYESNLRAARAAGQWDRAQRTKKTHPYFLYEPAPYEPAHHQPAPGRKPCDRHRTWAGTVLPVDDPWWDDHFPPNGWGCDCRVRPITRREADSRGGVTEPPPRREVAWWNRRAGRFEKTDAGLDPTWATNPGKQWARGPMGYLKEDLAPDDEDSARAGVVSVFESPILVRFMDCPRGDLAAGLSEKEVQGWLGARTRLVRLPEAIMEKQKGEWLQERADGRLLYRGHALTVEEYRLLPSLIGQPQLVLRLMPRRRLSQKQLASRLNLVSEVGGTYYDVVVGRFPNDPARVGVISFHQVDDGRLHVERMIRTAETGQDGQEVLRNALPARQENGKRDGTAPGSPAGPPGGLQNSTAR